MFDFLIIFFLGVLSLYIFWKVKRKKTYDTTLEKMPEVMYAWGTQGPFRTGAESSRAMRFGFLAVFGIEKSNDFEDVILGHEAAFNNDPAHWNSIIPEVLSHKSKVSTETLDLLEKLLASSKLSNESLNELKNAVENTSNSNISDLVNHILKIKDQKIVETYDDLRVTLHGLNWSEKCGAHEQHLKRRINNPLFPAARRLVTQNDVDAAISLDTIETIEMDEKRKEFYSKISILSDAIRLSDINEIREEVENLINECSGLGSKAAHIKKSFQEFRDKLIDAATQALSEEDRRQLIDVENLKNTSEDFQYLHSELGRQISRGDVIPSDEIILAVMSEDELFLRYFYGLADAEFKLTIAREVENTLASALQQGFPEEKALRIINALK